jgi:hypothetical protein
MKKKAYFTFKDTLILSFLLFILLFAGIFVGSMVGQVIRGEYFEVNSIEMAIIISSLILCVELAIVSMGRKKEEVDIKEMLKESRKEVY